MARLKAALNGILHSVNHIITCNIGIANKLSDKNNTEPSKQVSNPKKEVYGVDIGEGFVEKDQKLSIENCRNFVVNHTAKQKSCPAFCKKCFHCRKPNYLKNLPF